MHTHRLRKLLLVLPLLALPVPCILSQTLTSATVVGTVSDATGAAIPNATIHIRQLETDAVTSTISNSSGQYRFPFLKPGTYEVSAVAKELSSEPVHIQLLVGQEQSVDLKLGIADPKNYNSFTQSFPLLPTVHLRVNSLGFYGQDEWKILKTLNITYGARFECQGNPWCKGTCYSRASTEFLASGYQSGSAVAYNATLQIGSHKDFKQFEGIITEPRFGFAYSPLGDNNLVVRGGVGLFANTIAANIAANVYGNAPNKFSSVVTTGTVGLASDSGSSQAAAAASAAAFQAGFSQGDTLNQLL